MMEKTGDYVLGTHEDEVERLGTQHMIWRDAVHDAWQRAGVGAGSRVLDVGAGPGWATWDLADVVGPTGLVRAIERSDRFVHTLNTERSRRQLAQLEIVPGDLMTLGAGGDFDLAWCRWVACFVESVPRLVALIRASLRAGGRAVFHEYVEYSTWQFAPPRPHLHSFVAEVMTTWRSAGGEPNVAAPLIGALRAEGFDLLSVRPLVWVTRPGEPFWRWPTVFVATHVARLKALGRVSETWGNAVLAELREAEADASGVMVTPMVLEVIAERPQR